jgi:hypothetical protein
MCWVSALAFTIISYYAKNNLAYPLIAGLFWIVLGWSSAAITYMAFDTQGTPHPYTIQAGDPTWASAGLLGLVWLCWGIGIIHILLTGAWMLSGGRAGDKV